MKYIMLVGDGMCDRAVKEFDGKTPLQAARIPNMNMVAKEGQVGIASTIPLRLTPASDVANLSLLGYDPNKYYTGRAPLEAANMGVKLKESDVGFRCNLVTISDEKMEDYSAGHIKSKEAGILIRFLDEKLNLKGVKFYPGISYRHLTVIDTRQAGIQAKDFLNTICTPPHDITGKRIQRYMPRGKAAAFLTDLMVRSKDILMSHDINKVRVDLGENPASMIWLWGQGVNVHIPSFKEKFNVTGSIISAVDLIKGIGKTIGLDVINVPGATGYYDTNYKGKADYAIESLEKHDFVFIHVEAPDEAGHNGDARAKIAAIENIDRLIVGSILEHFQKTKQDFRILITSDHATPVSVRTHTREPIFFAVYGKGIARDEVEAFNEIAAYKASVKLKTGFGIIEKLLK
ncbi:MAG: cofactor-independent phosphoglycerate mutase [Candidatus Omnitrophica bacterium]|nr:cofactor-independent phosphoglycerate mutase [Candidatus Omnitrophota bacterium]